MVNKTEALEIKNFVKEAFDDMLEHQTDVLGIYNYIRYCNEDFGEDMYVNDDIPVSDNTDIQHCYLVCILYEAFKRDCLIPDTLLNIFNDNKARFQINSLDDDIQFVQQRMDNYG
ncbi:MAG: hypothetical protein KHY19_06995 [Coprobacillus cateniformis]|nr:hypothetical protein [Coprobacillus cateniformis]